MHPDYIIERYRGGFKLHKPTNLVAESPLSVQSILSNKFNVYLNDVDSKMQHANEHTLNVCGWDRRDIKGKSVIDLWGNRESLLRVIVNDREVIKTQHIRIAEEEVICKDGTSHTALSFKLPWFNDENKVVGFIGCTSIIGSDSFATLPDFLSELFKFKFLNNSDNKKLPGSVIDGIYYSKRQKQILNLVLRGKKTKEIAQILNLSPRTVGHYTEAICIKANVQTKSELIDKFLTYLNIDINFT